jgi:hypothetical protein
LLLSDPKQKISAMKNYTNTKFVNIVLQKRFFTKIETIAKKLSTKPEIIINNMLLLRLKKVGRYAKQNQTLSASMTTRS